jgi:hypothetical protein
MTIPASISDKTHYNPRKFAQQAARRTWVKRPYWRFSGLAPVLSQARMEITSRHSRRDCGLADHPELLLGKLLLLMAFCCCSSAEAQRLEYLAPTPVEATDAAFPTEGPALVVISLLAMIEPDGHISETQVVDSIGSSDNAAPYRGTLTGYIENSIAAGQAVAVSSGDRLKLEKHSLAGVDYICLRQSRFALKLAKNGNEVANAR